MSVATRYTRRQKLQDRRMQADALRVYWTALAKRASSPVDILCIGDSITEGTKASVLEQRWVALLRDKLRTRFPVAGVTGGQGYIPLEYYAPVNAGTPWTYVGGTSGLGTGLFGLGKRYRDLGASGDKATITVTCSSFDVFYTRGLTAGHMGVKVDAGSVTDVNTAGATQPGTRYSSGALTPGSHAIEISWQSGGHIFPEGIMVYNGDETKGIRIWEGGRGGTKSGFFFTTGNTTFWQKTILSIQPDLVIIELGTNDWWYNSGVVSGSYGSFPPADMRTNLLDIIEAVRTNCTIDPSFLLLGVHNRGDAGTSPGTVPLESWANYISTYYQMALADQQIAVLDIPRLIGPTPFSGTGLMDADNVHLSDAGNEFYANAIAGVLEP